jgi:hypothetical protein
MQAVRSVVRSQLEALRVQDARRALSCSTPGRQRYGTPEQFLEAITHALPQLVFSRTVEFEPPLEEVAGRVVQPVRVTGGDGSTLRALYLLEEQPDGSWLIEQCVCPRPATPGRASWVN